MNNILEIKKCAIQIILEIGFHLQLSIQNIDLHSSTSQERRLYAIYAYKTSVQNADG